MISVYKAVSSLINIIEVLIIVRIVFSFLNIRAGGFIIRFVYDMTEPVLGPARNLIARIGIDTGMFDFSPIIAIFILRAIQSIAYRILI